MFKMSFWLLVNAMLIFCPTIEAKSIIVFESDLNLRQDQLQYIEASLLTNEEGQSYDFEFYDDSTLVQKLDSLKYPQKLGLRLKMKALDLSSNNIMNLSAELIWFDIRTKEVFKSEVFSDLIELEPEKANAWRIVELISWKEENRHLQMSELKSFLKELAKKIVRNFILLKSPDYLSAQGGN